jgi:hypothetical protein
LIPIEDFVSDSFKVAEMRAEPDMFVGSDGNDIGTVHVQPDRRDPCIFQRSHHGRSHSLRKALTSVTLPREYISDSSNSFLLRGYLNAGNRHQLPVTSNSAKKAGLQLKWSEGDPTSFSRGRRNGTC